MFGARLRKSRERKGLTQEELASLLGTTNQQVSRWENSRQDVVGANVARLGEILGVTTDYLLGLVDEPQSYITEEELDDTERALIFAYRAGRWRDVLDFISKHLPDLPPPPELGEKDDVAEPDSVAQG